mmetsp:Transcript_413/g.739  ORF Transcript_413/g.739 Transcript_413/m.739 type:complete len:175 (-) Transcript_413:1625-2149(-)
MDELDEVLFLEERFVSCGKVQGRAHGAEMAEDEAFLMGKRKGIEFGIEFGFYCGVIERMRELQRSASEEDMSIESSVYNKWVDDISNCSDLKRRASLETLMSNLRKPSVVSAAKSVEELITRFPKHDTLTEENFAVLIRIRNKFKVLEARVGCVLEIYDGSTESSGVNFSGELF